MPGSAWALGRGLVDGGCKGDCGQRRTPERQEAADVHLHQQMASKQRVLSGAFGTGGSQPAVCRLQSDYLMFRLLLRTLLSGHLRKQEACLVRLGLRRQVASPPQASAACRLVALSPGTRGLDTCSFLGTAALVW